MNGYAVLNWYVFGFLMLFVARWFNSTKRSEWREYFVLLHAWHVCCCTLLLCLLLQASC